MEHSAPPSPIKISPDSSETTPNTPTFPNIPDPVLKSDIELARQNIGSARQTTHSLIDKLSRIRQGLSFDLGFEEEADNLMAIRRWAHDIMDTAWDVSMKAARLIDDVEYLLPRLEEVELPSVQVGKMHVNEQSDDNAKE
jgi:hypothetical protein